MTVCHLTYSFFPLVGGMEEFIHNLCLAQVEEGIRPMVVAPRVRGKDNRLDVPYRVARFSRPSSKRHGVEQILLPLFWRHARERFDVVHAHGVYPCGHLARLFRRLTGRPFIVTPEGGDLEGDDTGCIVSPLVHRRIARAFAEADRVTAISSDMRRRILKLGAPPERLVSIPHGVWTGELRPEDPYEERTAEDRYVAYIGSFIHRKGVDILLRAFARIHGDFPEVKLRLAGTGRLGDELAAQARDLELAACVEFTGVLRGEEKARFLQQALVLVCPSRGEPFGIVNVEGLAAGVPVLASRVGGIPDIILPGENGFLVDAEEVDGLARRLAELLGDDSLRGRLAANALEHAARFDWGELAGRYSTLYEEVLGRGPGEGSARIQEPVSGDQA